MCPTSSPNAIDARSVNAVIAINDRLWRTSSLNFRGCSIDPCLSRSAGGRRSARALARFQCPGLIRARVGGLVAFVAGAVPYLHPITHPEHDDVLVDPHAVTKALRDREPTLSIELGFVGRAEEQPPVRTPGHVGKGERCNLLGSALPLGAGEDEEAAVLADREPRAVGERLTKPSRQGHTPLRVELVAMRAEQFGQAFSPFLHLGPRLSHSHSTLVNKSCTRTAVRAQRESGSTTGNASAFSVCHASGEESDGDRTTRAMGTPVSRRRSDQVRLPAGLDLAKGQAEAVRRSEGLAMQMETRLLRRSVHLLRVAAAASRDHVLPHVKATPGAREHVVEVLGRGPAVLALPRIPSEHRPPRERGVRAERDVDEMTETDDGGGFQCDPLTVE